MTISDVTVIADRTHSWRYWRWMTRAAALVGVPISAAAGIAESPGSPLTGMISVYCLLVGGLSLYAALYSLVCLRRQGRVAYTVASNALRVTRGDRTLFECAVDEVQELEIQGSVPDKLRWLSLSLSYDWPQLLLKLEGRSQFKVLPPIMLWGHVSVDEAERRLRKAVRAA